MAEGPAGSLPPPSTTPPDLNPPRPAAPTPPPPPPAKPGHGCLWFIVIVLLLVMGGWLYMRHRATVAQEQKPAAKPEGTPTTVATATRGSVSVYLSTIGTVTPVFTDIVTSQINGIVTAVHYQEGQMVNAGDPLVDIDSRPTAAQLEEVQGQLERDQGLLDEARMDLTRYQQAWAQNSIPRQQLEDQEKLVNQYEGTVKNDQGMVQYQTVQLGFCRITAPIGGRTGLRLVDPGNIVAANGSSALVVITQVQPITVIFTVSEASLGEVAQQVHAGSHLLVEAWDSQDQNKLATGTLVSIDNQADTTTGTVKLRAQFDNSDQKLFPNEFVFTRLRVRTLTNQTLVPASAVQHNGDQAFVYVIQNNKAVLKSVKTGVTDNNMTAVQGINPGDVVANSSFDKLLNGATITVSKQPLPTEEDTNELIP